MHTAFHWKQRTERIVYDITLYNRKLSVCPLYNFPVEIRPLHNCSLHPCTVSMRPLHCVAVHYWTTIRLFTTTCLPYPPYVHPSSILPIAPNQTISTHCIECIPLPGEFVHYVAYYMHPSSRLFVAFAAVST